MNRQTAPIIAGSVAAIAAFVAWMLLDNSFGTSLSFAVLAGLIAFAVSYYQNRNRA